MPSEFPNRLSLDPWAQSATKSQWLRVHVPVLLQMRTTEEFLDYCIEHNIDMEMQHLFIQQYSKRVISPYFSLALREYGKVLDEALELDGEKKMTALLPRADVGGVSAASEEEAAAEPPAQQQLETFTLTEAGRKAGKAPWMAMLKGMARLGHFAPDEVERFRVVLGVALEFGRPVALTEPARFLSSKKELSFWVAMLLGNMSYITPDDGSSLEYGLGQGRYLCSPLIAAPRHNHWQLLDQCVATASDKGGARGASHRSYLTARRDEMEPSKACPIVRLLLPLGCRKV